MKKYRVIVSISGWKEFEVQAKNLKEVKTKIHETTDFEEIKNKTEWDIEDIEEVK